MINLEGLNKTDLKNLLTKLKLYNNLSKNLGKRAKKEYDRLNHGKSTYIVEYFPSMDLSSVEEFSLKAYKQFLNVVVNKNEINFVKKTDLTGGIRIICDDKMIDLSYMKFVNLLK